MAKLMKTSYAHQSQEDKKKIRKLMKASTVTLADNVVLARPDQETKPEPEEEQEQAADEKQDKAE